MFARFKIHHRLVLSVAASVILIQAIVVIAQGGAAWPWLALNLFTLAPLIAALNHSHHELQIAHDFERTVI